MVHIFRLFFVFIFLSHSANAGPSLEEDILESLHQAGYTKVVLQDIQQLWGTGSNTESVCRIRIDQKPLICKELKGIKNEQRNLEALEPFVSEYEKFKHSQPYTFPPDYPSLAKYRGALKGKNSDFVLFDLASGQSVFGLMVEWTQRGYGWHGLYPPNTRSHLRYAFENVGRTIANFHLKNGTFDLKSGSFETIVHGDLHISNIFYNLWSNETTFIDYETMANSNGAKRNIFHDVQRLLEFSKEETTARVREKAGAEFIKIRNTYLLDEKAKKEQISYIRERLDILDDFFRALKSGYEGAFTVAGYNCDTKTCKVFCDLPPLNECHRL